jgi:hypothetical protein
MNSQAYMQPNAKMLQQFYSSLNQHDHEAMMDCYHRCRNAARGPMLRVGKSSLLSVLLQRRRAGGAHSETRLSARCSRFLILLYLWFVNGPQVDIDAESITERVLSVQPTDPWTQAAVIIRENLGATSANSMIIITRGNKAAFQFRNAASGASTDVSFTMPIAAPCWVRLVRTGTTAAYTFTGSVSIDGITGPKSATPRS